MIKSILLKRVTNKIGSKEVTTVLLNQDEINIKVKEELGHLLIIDTDDRQ